MVSGEWYVTKEREEFVKSIAREILDDKNFGMFDYAERERIKDGLKKLHRYQVLRGLRLLLNDELAANKTLSLHNPEIRSNVKAKYLKNPNNEKYL